MTILSRCIPITLALLILTASCKGKEAPVSSAKTRLNSIQMAAKFPYDLGAATVDISTYPEQIQKSYPLFLAVCSVCHTPARPLNSPYAKAEDWKRFIRRMHLKMELHNLPLDKAQEKQIIEFLVYDSKIRKIDHKNEFDIQQAALKQLFEEVSKERDKLTLEETEQLPKKETPYVGVK